VKENSAQTPGGSAVPGAPIGVEEFLKSWGLTLPAAVGQPAAAGERRPAIAKATPQNEAKLYANPQFKAIEAGMSAWYDTNYRRSRPDLVGVATREAAGILEDELKAAIAAAYGSSIGGNGASGTDIPNWVTDIKTIISRQSRLRYGCSCERALGTAEHVLVVNYSLSAHHTLLIGDAYLVPRWRTADIVASAEAERLRRKVNAGELAAAQAAFELVDNGLVPAVCHHLIAALVSDEEIQQGSLTLSRVEPVWQASYAHVSTSTRSNRMVQRVKAADPSKVATLVARRLKAAGAAKLKRAAHGSTELGFQLAIATVALMLVLAPLALIAAAGVGFFAATVAVTSRMRRFARRREAVPT
jgi:hypothetical protein